jgi:tetraacyldisaccharide 4'-kinase
MENFEAIVSEFAAAEALTQIADATELEPAIDRILNDPARAKELGQRGRDVVEQQQGASKRVAAKLMPLYQLATPTLPWSWLARAALTPLSALWTIGGTIKRRRALRQRKALPCPVISIGGISAGGSGKTPFVNYLAGLLRARGWRPAILTRGYRRRSLAKYLVFSAGADVPPALTGDEAQIFLKAGIAAVGIGRNRYEAGRLLLKHIDADVFVLDDGFQHALLERNVDVVLIDGLDPFGGYATIPLGRLREPLSALKRADAFVVTRVSSPHRYRAIAHELHGYNAAAPIFQATAVSRRWRLCREGTKIDGLLTGKVAAFCGLGNPQAFWNMLEQLGLEVVYRWAFSDHHVYAPVELYRLRQQAQEAGAGLLVTTEKDRMNLPAGVESIVAPLELAWLEIHYELDREAEFLAYLEQRMKKRTTAEVAGLLTNA